MPKTCLLKPGLSDGELMKNIKNFGCEEMVIKPAVGASGKGTLRLDLRTMSQKTKEEILKMSKGHCLLLQVNLFLLLIIFDTFGFRNSFQKF